MAGRVDWVEMVDHLVQACKAVPRYSLCPSPFGASPQEAPPRNRQRVVYKACQRDPPVLIRAPRSAGQLPLVGESQGWENRRLDHEESLSSVMCSVLQLTDYNNPSALDQGHPLYMNG